MYTIKAIKAWLNKQVGQKVYAQHYKSLSCLGKNIILT